jgi:pimeloyl-ACP methyl ester carboxylesterase
MKLKAIVCTAAAVLALAAPAAAADLSKSVVPGYPDVVGEYLQVPGFPAAGTPKGLNTATFLRVRAAADGETPKPANAVILALPGFASTPAHWLFLASQLVHKANGRTCEGKPCRLEVWVLQRRGANLSDTKGFLAARAKRDPKLALTYYYGTPVTQPMPGKGAPARVIAQGPDAKWKPLSEGDLAFMADWGFQAYSGDVDAMLNLIKVKAGTHTVFLAGHSQGGGFVANYASRMQPDGPRGVEKFSGLIFLDGGPAVGAAAPPTEAQLKAYFDHVADLRSGKAKVYTDASGLLGAIAGPVSGMSQSVVGMYAAYADPNAEAFFPLRAVGMAPAPGDDFLKALRVTWLSRAGVSFDTEPVPGAGVQTGVIRFLGQGLGRLDFTPLPGTEALCDKTPEPPTLGGPPRGQTAITCTPTGAMVDPNKVYGWIEGGGNSTMPNDAGKAKLWLASQGWAPARTNLKPVTVTFKESGLQTLDASSMVAGNWYASERWDYDANFMGRYRVLKLDRDGVKVDLDKTAIAAIPVYVARQSPKAGPDNPFPGVTDYTEINKTGTYQTAEAKALTPIDPKINVAINHHTDFIGADDSTPDKGKPGDAGNSAVANTLIDWVLKRSKGVAITPTPKALGVREAF